MATQLDVCLCVWREGERLEYKVAFPQTLLKPMEVKIIFLSKSNKIHLINSLHYQGRDPPLKCYRIVCSKFQYKCS